MGVARGDPSSPDTEISALRQRIAALEAERVECLAQLEALKISEKKHRQLVENTHDILYTLTADGVFQYVSPAWSRLLGHPLDEVVGHHFAQFVHPDDLPACYAFLHEVVRTGERQQGIEYRALHADGTWRWHTSNASPDRNASGMVTHYDGIASDITERKQAEQALRRSEANLRAIMSNTSDLIASYDREVRLVAYNQACVEAFRQMVNVEIHPGFRPLDIFQEPMRSFWESNNARVLAGEAFVSEFELKLPDGTRRVLESSFHPIRQGTEVVGFTTTTRDVTERTREANALRESASRLRAITDATQDAIIMLDSMGLITFWNPAAETILGYSADEAIGRNAYDLLAPQNSIDAQRAAFPQFARPARGNFTLTARCKDAREIRVSLSLSAILLGSEWHAVGILRDITEQKRAQDALAESEARFRAMVNLAPDGIVIASLDGHILEASETAASQVGTPRERLLQMNLKDIVAPRYAAALGQLERQTEQPSVHESAYIRPDGTEVQIELSVRRISFRGEPAVLSVARDVTERKLAEQEREKLQSQLAQAQKVESVGRLAGGVAHDFNNMLGVILGHSQLAMDELDPTHPVYADLREIHQAAERSADLTRQLLGFARKQTIAPQILDLNDTVDGMLKMLRRLIGEDIELTWIPGHGVGSVIIDPSQVNQILTNLCVNARDAIAGVGRLTIETTRAYFDEEYCLEHTAFVPGDYVALVVSDDGSGMSAEAMSHLFEPFFTTKETGKGTGLGLATVFGIVRQNNGFINVYSELGRGTTFRVYLPSPAPQSARPSLSQSPAIAAPGTETVLLVEDEPAIRRVTQTMLQRLGYTVLAASTPGEALQLAREYSASIDLLLTDVVMPEMNGRDLAKRLSSLFPNMKRVFMSGYTANVIAHHGVLDEGLCFLEKPFSSKQLGAKLREALGPK